VPILIRILSSLYEEAPSDGAQMVLFNSVYTCIGKIRPHLTHLLNAICVNTKVYIYKLKDDAEVDKALI